MKEIELALRQAIDKHGSISFAQFMDTCLYHPDFGYYQREESKIGRRGDFYTNVSVGALFGELLAYQFGLWLEPIDGPLQIVEAGAHDGTLAADILAAIGRFWPKLAARMEYWIIEPSTKRQKWQEQGLQDFPNVRWIRDLASVEERGVTGVIFSNELLDAMPVHLMSWNAAASQWMEKRIIYAEKFFQFSLAPLSAFLASEVASEKLLLAPEVTAALPDKFTLEIAAPAREWWRAACKRLGVGKILTIDYGLRAEEFLHPARREGTVRAYRQHRQSFDLLGFPGEQDLTAHVNFTHLQGAGEAEGLRTQDLLSQGKFLTQIMAQFPPERLNVWTPSEKRQFQTLVHPEQLGAAFKVLLQCR